MIESRARRTYIRDHLPAEQARAFEALAVRLTQITSGQGIASNVVQIPINAA